jgi:hypothetical protein
LTLKTEAICSSETSVDSGLHGVIFKKMIFFITTAVRTSNPTIVFSFEECHLLGYDAVQSVELQEPASKQVASSHLLTCWFLLNYFFDHEDGGDIFLRNVGCNSTDYTASYPRR